MPPLSPLDLLALSDEEHLVIQCLTRQPRQTLAELAQATGLPTHTLSKTLLPIIASGGVVEQLSGGERRFSVHFNRMHKRNIAPGLLNLFETSPETLLASTPLTATLDESERQRLLSRSTRRTLLVDEVYSWQGNPVTHVGLLVTGLVQRARLLGKQRTKTTVGYIRRGEWFGLSEALSGFPTADTYAAVTESELLLWRVEDFIAFASSNAQLSLAINRLVSEQLQQCQSQQTQGLGVLWVVEALHPGAGATTLAANLALLATRNGVDSEVTRQPRVALWNVKGTAERIEALLGSRATPRAAGSLGAPTVLQHESGLDILLSMERGDYPPQVELDIVLATLQRQYDYVICDTGADATDSFLEHLRGRAQTLITLTREVSDAERAPTRWNALKPFARPGQKRVLALNGAAAAGVELHPAFHLVLPRDEEALARADGSRQPVVESDPDSQLSRAFHEVYRRLSLTQTVAIFIPSTVDVDQAVDNEAQVQAALAFLGHLFGGATSSDGEGVWRSEESGLVVERVTIVRSFVSDKALKKHLDEVIHFAVRLKEEMKQEAVAIDVNNELVLV